MTFIFRKRALHPGAGVGLHEQHEDEVYYVLSGKGVMTVDDTKVDMTPGTAVLTRPGSSHSLKQIGSEDLVVLISYEIK
jgi:mannose-6-phosphate isomerase-like protein (cupin superfamily)